MSWADSITATHKLSIGRSTDMGRTAGALLFRTGAPGAIPGSRMRPKGLSYAFTSYVAGDKAVVGDWTGSHTTKIGIYRGGFWILDTNGNGVYDGGVDPFFSFGGNPGEIPVVGDWNGDGRIKIGFYLRGFWALDYNGNGSFDGLAAGQDRFFALGGTTGEQLLIGAW